MMINYTVKRQTWRINKQNILVNFHIIQYVGRRRRRRFVVFLFRWWRSFIRNRFTHFYLDALRPSFFSCIFLFWLFENDYIDFDCAIVAFIVGFAILCLIALINLFINQEPPIPEMLYIIFSQRYTWHDLLIHYWIHTTTIKTHKRTQRIIFCSLIYIFIFIMIRNCIHLECTQQTAIYLSLVLISCAPNLHRPSALLPARCNLISTQTNRKCFTNVTDILNTSTNLKRQPLKR